MKNPGKSFVFYLFAMAAATAACGPGGSGNSGSFLDVDGDGFSPAQGDCDDNNPLIYEGAVETEDGLDNDCDGLIDNNLYNIDNDGDGYAGAQGDCDDTNPLIGPDAAEVNLVANEAGELIAEGIDNDCDGLIDEGTEPCDGALAGAADDANNFARAIELCQWVQSAEWLAGTSVQRSVVGSFGSHYDPIAGSKVALLSSGAATVPVSSFLSGGSISYPGYDPTRNNNINDPVVLRLTIKVPVNANGFSFDFAFFSEEFAQYVGSQFNDRFMVNLTSSSYSGNISFDANDQPISINAAFMSECSPTGNSSAFVSYNVRANCANPGNLSGTGFETNGGTGLLRTQAPVTPGEIIVLDFIIGDVSDHVLDSSVIIDNFQWIAEGVLDPGTNPS